MNRTRPWQACSVLGLLLLLSCVLTACGSTVSAVSKVDVADDVASNVERAFPQKWYKLYVMKDSVPKTEAEMSGRRWILCSSYDDAANNMLWLSQNAQSLQMPDASIITGPRSGEDSLFSDAQKALDANPEAILVIDGKSKFEALNTMVELKLE
jgi:hypothetical protein